VLATLDAKRVICLCVVIFASDGMKTQIVIYPNNRIIVNIIKVDTMVSTHPLGDFMWKLLLVDEPVEVGTENIKSER